MAKMLLHKDKKTGVSREPIKVSCLRVRQSDFDLYVFKMKASLAWRIFSISRKEPDSNKGYQRFLSEARVASVSKYIKAGNPVPVKRAVTTGPTTDEVVPQMAWYRNYYECDRCGYEWQDEWSCMCDDDCPECGARHMSPYDSDELTEVISEENGKFVVLWSPETAEHDADYRELGRFATRAEAEAFLATG